MNLSDEVTVWYQYTETLGESYQYKTSKVKHVHMYALWYANFSHVDLVHISLHGMHMVKQCSVPEILEPSIAKKGGSFKLGGTTCTSTLLAHWAYTYFI